LLENFGVVNSTYESASQWKTRGDHAKSLQSSYPINLSSVSVIANTDGTAQNKFNFSRCASQVFNVDAHGSSDTYYGAGSASVTFWTRPDLTHLGQEQILRTEYAISTDGNKYLRYLPSGRISLDFTSGSEVVTITKW
jgi:hypothetical protein